MTRAVNVASSTSLALVTPTLGTPTSGVATNLTGLPLTTGVTGTLPVANGGTGVTTSTGSGANVLGTSPTLTTPTFNSAQLATVSGTAPLYMCRAWVNFDGTTASPCTIRGSGNVSSVTKNGTGDYTINFTTAMPDANYGMCGASGDNNGGGTWTYVSERTSTARTASLIRIFTGQNVFAYDSANINVSILR